MKTAKVRAPRVTKSCDPTEHQFVSVEMETVTHDRRDDLGNIKTSTLTHKIMLFCHACGAARALKA